MSNWPAHLNPNQRVMRRPVNENDKSTIVSIFPRDIKANNPAVFPGRLHIPAAKKGEIELAVVGQSSSFKEMLEGEPLLEIPYDSFTMANSFVDDICKGVIEYVKNEQMPGLFVVYGDYDKKTIHGYVDKKTNRTFAQYLAEANRVQNKWFAELIKMADVLWVRTQGNPRSIDDNMKLAAIHLGQEDKPWIKLDLSVRKVSCPACGNLVDPSYPICANCKTVINAAKAKELGLKFASVG